MMITNFPNVSPSVNAAFNVARAKNRADHTAWINLSGVLSGRFHLPVAMMNIQRQGDLDLLLRCMEDEYEINQAAANADTAGADMTLHYQLTLSELWVIGCYEVLRAFRQRDDEARNAGLPTSGVSEMETFQSIFADLELLRMPMVKFEIARDRRLKEPLLLQRSPPNNDATDQASYDGNDPARYHIMPNRMSARGSVCWAVLNLATRAEYWVERRNLSERMLAMGAEIVPAGILEAQEGIEASR